MATESSVLILGAGIFGTSTAFHLAKSYKDASRITVIDRPPSPPEFAASVDSGGRIIQADYPSRLYCNLAYEAMHAWFWDLHLGPFFNRPGCLVMGEEGSSLCEDIRKVFKERGFDQTEMVALSELEQAYGGVFKGTEVKGFKDMYWNPEAGWVNAAGATASYMKAAEDLGVQRVTGEVKQLLIDDVGVQLADGKRFTADKIVLATGAWTSSLLSPVEDSLNIAEQDRVERQVQATGIVSAYYNMSAADVKKLAKMPVVTYGDRGEVIPPSEKNPILKFSSSKTFTNTIKTESGRKITAPSSRSQRDVPEQLKQETEKIIIAQIPPEFTRGRKPDRWRICWDALTPTKDFLLCQHPHKKLSSIYLAVGGSFHSYKFLPNSGKYMLNVLNGQSNGAEKDNAWGWKGVNAEGTGSLDKTALRVTSTKRELRDLEGETSSNKAKL